MILFLKNLLFTVLVPGFVAVFVPLQIVLNPYHTFASPWGPSQVTALVPLTIGAAIYFWCLWDFALRGRGTPAPIDAPKHLVLSGLYRYLRNPMYIGVLLMISGWSLFFRSAGILLYAAALWLFFHLFVKIIEEPVLRRKFGDEYANYCEQVGRWVPRLRNRTNRSLSG